MSIHRAAGNRAHRPYLLEIYGIPSAPPKIILLTLPTTYNVELYCALFKSRLSGQKVNNSELAIMESGNSSYIKALRYFLRERTVTVDHGALPAKPIHGRSRRVTFGPT